MGLRPVLLLLKRSGIRDLLRKVTYTSDFSTRKTPRTSENYVSLTIKSSFAYNLLPVIYSLGQDPSVLLLECEDGRGEVGCEWVLSIRIREKCRNPNYIGEDCENLANEVDLVQGEGEGSILLIRHLLQFG